jgi:uncharacterized delta-60 repeat protein
MQNLAKRTRTLMALAIVLSPAMVKAQSNSTLDPTFGTGGIVATDFAGTGASAAAITVQADGKLVVAGGAGYTISPTFALTRYNSNGTLDASFGTGGKVTTDVGGRFESARAVALQGDGKIVVAGSTVNGLFNDFAVVRYNSNGTLDTSFGTGGKVITDFGVSAQVASAAVQPDGKILVGGFANLNGGYNFELVRYNSDGTLDLGFGTGGKVTTDFGLIAQGFSFAQADSLAVQQDGKIVLSGLAFLNNAYNFALARYNSNGTLDTGFGTGGKVITTFPTPNPNANCEANSVAIQPDGKIVAAGIAALDFALARYNSNGTLDTSFGTGGKLTTDIAGSTDFAGSVVVQGDGKIFAAGRAFVNGDFHSALARYNSNGSLDTTFGTGGKLTNIFGVDSEAVNSLAVQPDGKIVAAGGAVINGVTDFALARFNSGSGSNPNINPNASFVKVDTTTGGSWKGVYGLDGYIVIGDSASAPSYGNVTPAGNNTYVWSGSTGETRALQKASSATDRIAACWYSGGAFTIDLNFTDTGLHQVALYMLDWDSWGGGRTQQVDVFDANNHLLDTRMVSGFTDGQYLVWNLSGHVTIRVTNTNPNGNAVVSGLFFR